MRVCFLCYHKAVIADLTARKESLDDLEDESPPPQAAGYLPIPEPGQRQLGPQGYRCSLQCFVFLSVFIENCYLCGQHSVDRNLIVWRASIPIVRLHEDIRGKQGKAQQGKAKQGNANTNTT